MTRRRERFPYEWQVSLSAAVLLGLSVVIPSTPFSGVLALWTRWIAKPLLGWQLFANYHSLPSLFVPLISAVGLGYTLLVFRDQGLGRLRRFTWFKRAVTALMILLGAAVTADAAASIGVPLEIGEIVLSCAVGLLLLLLGSGLYRVGSLGVETRVIAIGLLVAGACIASFALLPIGLIALLLTYVGFTISLAREDTAADDRETET